MQDLRVTIIQTAPHWEDAQANRDKFNALMPESGSSDLILLPEMFNTGFTMNAAPNAEAEDGPTVRWMQEQAERTGSAIGGSLIIEESGKYYNRFFIVSPDGNYQTYNKKHLFRMGDEHDTFTPGNERVIVEVKGWRICPQICYDLRFPVWNRNRDDYDLMIFVASWPKVRTLAWTSLLQARAIENIACVIGVNRVGTDGNGVAQAGNSMVISAKGDILFQNESDEVVHQEVLSANELAEWRSRFPAHLDADSFDLT
jgi:predicted amidohydrolase